MPDNLVFMCKVVTECYIASVKEVKIVSSGSFEKDRSSAAWLLLRYVFKKRGIDVDSLSVSHNKNGKPYFDSFPLFFNLSHSGDYVMCIVSDSECGCDIEQMSSVDEGFVRRFLSKEEYNFIYSTAKKDEQLNRFYRIWTLKESFLKAVGTGITVPLSSFSVNVSEDNKISVTQNIDSREFCFEECMLLYGYKCSVCVAGENIDKVNFHIGNF